MTHDMPCQLPFSEERAGGNSPDVMQGELRRLVREEVSGALKAFFSVSSKVAQANAGKSGTSDAASNLDLIGIKNEPARASEAASTLDLIGNLVNAHHVNLQGVSMHSMEEFNIDDCSEDSKWRRGKQLHADGKQIRGLTGIGVDARHHGEYNDLLGCEHLEARLPVMLSEQFGILSDRLHAQCADLIVGQTEKILKLVNEQRSLPRDITSDSKSQSVVVPSLLPTKSSQPHELIEPASEPASGDCDKASVSVDEPPQTTVQLSEIFDGAWEDADGKFYGGSLIVFDAEGWKPMDPPEPAQRTAKYTMQPRAETQCYLYENRKDGTSRRFLATADPAQPDRLQVTLAESRMKWTLRQVSQQEGDRRAKRSRLKLNQAANPIRDTQSLLRKLADFVDRLAGHEPAESESDRPVTPAASLYDRFQAWSATLMEPKRVGPLARIVEGGAFKFVCTAVILVQAVYSTVAMNESMQKAEQGDTYEDNARVEGAFLAFYTVELLLRLLVHRLYFFINDQWTWNVFDFGLVVQSAFDMLVEVVMQGNSGLDMAFLRPLRIFKIAKILRTFRALKYFTEIRLMLFCILQSLSTLFWCLLLIVFVQYLFSMLFVQGMAEFLSSQTDMSPDTRSAYMGAFGSVQASIISLWMAVTGGDDWSQYYYMIDKTSTWRGFVFMFYIAFVLIAAMNIVTGTFVNKAFDIARPDAEAIFAAKRQRDAETYKSLADLFKHANKSRTGSLSKDEFVTVISKEKHATLEIMGITHVDAESLFDLMKGGEKDTEVELDTFAEGMLGLSGGAKCVDVHLCEHRILEKLRDMHYTLNGLSPLHV